MEKLLTTSEVAAYLRCTERTVRSIPRDLLHWSKPGRERLYTQEAVQSYLAGKAEKPKPERHYKRTESCGSLKQSDRRIGRRAGRTPTAAVESFHSLLEKRAEERLKRELRNSGRITN